MKRHLLFWGRRTAWQEGESSPDPPTSLNGNADREVGQPDSSVRAGSLQAGEDLPGGVSVPGALAGERGGRMCKQSRQQKYLGRGRV